jgi:Tol biopolymer transport system component
VFSARRLLVLLLLVPAAFAQREYVLKQIDVPHPYYNREMYLPQLTTGPSAAAWLDAKTLAYSMGGSLWKQALDSSAAEQLTAGPGYDYQPDCAAGRWIVYAKYDHDAVELWSLDLQTKRAQPLTQNGAVNVEPRFSPDGKRIVFVSTSYNGRFHIFAGDFRGGQLTSVQRLTGENRSSLPRYYYSVYDHEISPTWSPDGIELIFVSNRGHLYGTGGLWRMKAEPGAEARQIYGEETTWKARPDWSSDGRRMVWASYNGRVWHQLWLLPTAGGAPMPLTYGDYDNTNPRWSPDANRIAFISNRDGNTSLWVVTIPGGKQQEIIAQVRRYLQPMGTLTVQVLDPQGQPTPARVSVTAADGRSYAPDDLWMHADDQFERGKQTGEAHYFHLSGSATLTVPAGNVEVEVMKGFAHKPERRTVAVSANGRAEAAFRLQALDLPADARDWVSSDLHVHMNYAGTYRNTPAHLALQAEAEDLGIVQNLIVNKEQRILDMSYFSTQPDPASTAHALVLHGQEFHTSYWGHLGLLHLTDHYLLPDYAGYDDTAAASLVPTNADIADMTHAQHGLVGYVHPFEEIPDPAHDAKLTHELPADVALGKADYIEVVGFADHKATAAVWYRLLNCGFHLPTGAGTDAMANYASLRGPVGLNRVYARVSGGKLDSTAWLESLRQGHTFATNGPLLGFTLGEKSPGDELQLAAKKEVPFRAWLRSIVPLDHLQIVCQGKVVRDLALSADRTRADVEGTLPVTSSGWCVLRAFADKPEHPIMDMYPYATTSPVYIRVGNESVRSPEDAAYFIAWIDRLVKAAGENENWNTGAEKTAALEMLARARKVYEAQTR